MTPLQREALQMCLEYIETDAHERRHVRWKINEALAQPQQEPVAKIEITRCKFTGELESWTFAERPRNAPAGTYYVYTTPQPAQRQPLTDEEVETVWRSVQANDFHDCVKPFARAIEAKHNIKENT